MKSFWCLDLLVVKEEDAGTRPDINVVHPRTSTVSISLPSEKATRSELDDGFIIKHGK